MSQESQESTRPGSPRIDDLRIDRRDERPRRSGRLGVVVGVIVVLVVIAGAVAYFLRPQPPQVTVATVQTVAGGGSAGAVLNASGYVTARREATVSSKVTGKVVEVLVEEGMRIEEGQVLARLDDAIPRAELALAEAQLQAAKKGLAENEVRLAEATLNRRRMERLVADDVSSQSDLDAAAASEDSYAARLALGREQVVVAERQLALARQALADTVIRAPFAGIAVSKDAQPGEMISPVSAGGGFTRTGICTLVDMASLEIEVDVNESYIKRVEPEQRVEAVLDAYPDWTIPGRVIITIPTADRQKATVKVRVGFDQLDPRILPDMGVKVAFLESAEAEGAAPPAPRVVVPRSAVRDSTEGGEQGAVLVLAGDGETVERRAVRLGAVTGDEVEVLAGLAGGERVVTEGPTTLADGDRVQVKP